MEALNDLLSYLDKLQGMSAVALVFFSCIVAGYIWRLIPHEWFPNKAIPIIVILWGAFAFSLIADARVSTMPFRVWFMRNVLVGAVVGFLAWMLHNYLLAKVEEWVAGKFPRIGNTAFFGRSSTGEGTTVDKPN